MNRYGAQNMRGDGRALGNELLKPGRYHVVVQEVLESDDKFPDRLVFEFRVLAGTMPGQEGRVIRELFLTSREVIPRLQRLALVLGVIKPGDPKREVTFLGVVGRDLVIEVKKTLWFDSQLGKARSGSRVSEMGFWATGTAMVADVPKGELNTASRCFGAIECRSTQDQRHDETGILA